MKNSGKNRNNYNFIFLVDLPDPVHGMSNVNHSVLSEALSRGIKPVVINTAPSYAASFYGKRLWGVIKFCHSFVCALRLFFYLVLCSESVVYRPINGGLGQVYDFGYIILCKIFGSKILIHHHSFNYLNNRRWFFKVLNQLGGKESIHIVLGARMKEKLIELYGIYPEKIHILSNIAFFSGNRSIPFQENRPIVVGHLANLCVEKGIGDFIALCEALSSKGYEFRAHIAGPYTDLKSKEIIGNVISKLPQVKYLGPLYGADKDSFFQGLDIFVFPSHYCNEAEPLVLYEAAQFGVLNLGTRRGCMASVIKSLGGISFDERGVVTQMANAISDLEQAGSLGLEAREERVTRFLEEKARGSKALDKLFELMVG
ncbi:glycosyltransferase family 4 protein [uncultured Neptuniibacter sp.]|uniref:glycosyltransferase family 4 protein n=2 Tax=Neptuniibacter TaxID=459520 RepID=UPI0032B2EB5B|tara:strand:- start:4494 stop:5606 length:1113 start_codon:yes stop_codon:yes gene_type:complete